MMAAMDEVTNVRIKQEEVEDLPNDPVSMFLDGPLGVYWSIDHINEDSKLNFGWDENENNNAVVNTLLHTILEVESECCPPPLLVPKKELFLEDPLLIEDPGLYIKQDPELNLDVDVSDYNVVASRNYASNSTRLLQSIGTCDFRFEDTVRRGMSHSELEISSEERTHVAIFCEGEEEEEEEKEEEESLLALRQKCSLREKKCQIFSCSFCLRSFSSKYRLMIHVFVHIDGVQPPKFVCKSCGEVFPSYVSLQKHLKFSETDQDSSADKEETFDCSGGHCSILPDDREYSGMDHTKRRCSSSETVKSFTDKYNTHITTNNSEIRDRNDNNGTFYATGKVKVHTVPHLDKRSHKCDVCGKSFTKLSLLKTHGLIHTGTSAHKCDTCEKSFTLLNNLKRHVSIHTAIKPHTCDICGQSFTRSSHLKNHALIHSGIKPHKCDICGKSFTELGSLKRHSLIHSGIKRHKCDICGKTFTELGSLKIHSLFHTGMLPHKCDICGRSFTVLRALKRHALIHSGIRPYQCDICSKSFTRLSHLKRHKLIHTGR